MDINLKENERIDDLEFKNLKIIQNKNNFCFGIDAVLISDFAKNIKKDSTVIDLGTGNGIIPILLCGKTELKEIIGVEIQKDVASLAKKNIKLNNLEKKFKIINENIINLKNKLKNKKFDVVITNPPYKKLNSGLKNESENKLISRHEVTASLEDFVRASKDLLVDKGEFYMVHRPERLVDVMTILRANNIEPKVLKMIFSDRNSEPKLFLIKGIKNAKPFLRIEKNLYIYDDEKNYTEEILKIYNKK